MKIIPILPSYQAPVLKLATIVKFTLRDGTKMGFTSFNKDIVMSEEPDLTYFAFSGVTPSAISSTDQFNVDNMEIDGFLDSEAITEADLKAGRYDYADVVFAELDWGIKPYTWQKVHIKRVGKLGEVSLDGLKFKAEVRGLTQYLQTNIGDRYQPTCRAIFGDSKCKLDITPYQSIGTVTGISQNRVIQCNLLNDTGIFNEGKLVFTSGLNTGIPSEIKSWDSSSKTLEIQLSANYQISIGDTFIAIYGCDGVHTTCRRFNNIKNFRGEPYIPLNADLVNGAN